MSPTTPRTPTPRPPRQLSAARAGHLDADPPQVARLEVGQVPVTRPEVPLPTKAVSPAPAAVVPPAPTTASPTGVTLPVATPSAVPQARRTPSVRLLPTSRSAPEPPLPILPGPAPTRQVLLPNVLIPGVSHAGAVRLAADLGRHPDVCLPEVKRIGHFTPLRYGRAVHTPLDEYDRYFARWSGQRYRLESGPDYFDGGTAMVHQVADSFPGVRVVLVLGDPVHRLWTSYHDKLARGRVPRAMGFESYVDRCLALRANGVDRFEGNRHFRTLSSGFYVEFLPAWLDAFGRRARVVFTEDLQTEPVAQVGALFDWLGLDPCAVDGRDDDEFPGEGYGSADPWSAAPGRWWWQLLRRPVLPGPADQWAAAAGWRRPRQLERRLADVRALYVQANRDLAALLRDRGYGDLPEWLGTA
jgi:hypothetical protein